MKRFITFTLAAVLTVGLSATLRSQTGGAGGAGGASGGAGASGSAGTSGAGSSSTTGTTGSTSATGGTGTSATGGTGTAGTAGAAGTTGTAGAGATGTTGTAGATNRSAAAGSAGIGTNGTPGLGRGGVNGTGRANANAGLNNAARRANVNGRNGMSQTPFFSDPGVRQQLNLNDTQYNTLNRNYQDSLARYNEQVNRLSPGLTPEQRSLQMERLQQQFNQNLAGNALENPQTLNRFNQLNRQFAGFNGFNDPTIRQQLNLRPEQIRQLRTVQNNFRQQLQQFRRGAGNDLSSVDQAQWNQVMQQYVSTLNNVLTPEQQQAWQQMVGQPYMFSPNLMMTQQLPDGNVSMTPQVGTAVPRGQATTGTTGTTTGTSGTTGTTLRGTTGTQTPTGTQATQGTTTQGTTQGGTVR